MAGVVLLISAGISCFIISIKSPADPHALALDMPVPTVEIVVEKSASFEVACRQSFVRSFIKFGCEKTVEKSVAFPFGMVV